MIQVENAQACTGCLICELACSFHHIRQFSRGRSSIKVRKPIFDPGQGPEIHISRDKEAWEPACDLCRGETTPFCIRFCPENVLRLERSRPWPRRDMDTLEIS